MADLSASGSSPNRSERTPSPFFHSDTTPRDSYDGLPPLSLPRRNPSGSSAASHTTSVSPPPRTGHAGHAGHRTAHRHNRSSGGFLLSDALDGAVGYDAGSGTGVGRTGSSGHTRSTRQSPGKSRSSSGRVHAGHGTAHGGSVRRADTPERLARPMASSTASPSPSMTHTDATAAARSSTPDNAASLAVDSAQIVNMALKLSETRRLVAAHRPLPTTPTVQNGGVQATAQPLPPRLTPLPDSAVGGSLRHQLQQQRRLSRTASPRPDKGPGGGSRAVSASSTTSASASNNGHGLQPAFEPTSDVPNRFCYNFSPPTLARAQKAKDYLELLAQQRRLLSLLPPLAPPPAAASSRSRATSFNSIPLASSNSNTEPSGSGTAAPALPLGRPYNPLQYIRNRKVRARERKTIDGQAQGFGDVGKTTAWIDEVENWATAVAAADARSAASTLPPPLPPFPRADQCIAGQQGSSPPPATAVSRVAAAAGAGALGKPKRARIDWDIDPADMLADIYWLEQDDNKRLVEDRNWRRVFPQDPGLYRPLSRRTDDSTGAAPPLPNRPGYHEPDPLVAPLSTLSVDPTDQVLRLPPLLAPLSPSPEDGSDQEWSGSTRQRARESARQKLQEIRGFHHRHPGTLRGHSRDHVLRLRRNSSSSSSSDSDSDGRRRRPKVATGSWKTHADPSYGTANGVEETNRDHEPGGREKDREQRLSGSSVSTQAANPNNAAGNGARSSLETPGARRRLSVEYESSQPTSPELNPLPNTGLGFVPTLGDNLSTPPSRTTSPHRHHQRFSKVKSIFRDHSRERDRSTAAGDRMPDERDAEGVGSAGGGDLLVGETKRQQQQQQSADATAAAGTGASEGSYTVTPVVTINGQGPDHGGRHGSSRSPVRKVISAGSRTTAPGAFDGGHRAHESMGSMANLRNDSNVSGVSASPVVSAGTGASAGSAGSNSGFRGLMRGARIGTMFGASKVSDMFWRRGPAGGDSSASGPAGANGIPAGTSGQNGQSMGPAAAAEARASLDSSSDEDSDGAAAANAKATTGRGRSRKSALSSRSPSAHLHVLGDEVSPMTRLPGSRPTAAAAAEAVAGGKSHHYLDVMPTFGRSDSATTAGTGAGAAAGGDPISRPPSRQSARFDRLKPPRIDVQDVSPRTSSPNPGRRSVPRRGSQLDSDMSEADGRVSRSRRSSHVSHVSRASRASMGMAGKSSRTGSPQRNRRLRGSRPFGSTSTLSAPASVRGDRQGRWSVSQSVAAPGGSLSRRELARLRASLYSSAVLAHELIRRVNEPRVLVSTGWTPGRRRLNSVSSSSSSSSDDDNDDENDDVAVHTGTETEPEDDIFPGDRRDGRKRTSRNNKRAVRKGRSRSSGSLKSVVVVRGSGGAPQWDGHAPAQFLTWADIAAYAPDPEAVAWRPVKQVELYPLAGQVLGAAVQRQGQAWQASAEAFTGQTAPQLRARIEQVRTQVAGALSDGARHAADAADEVNRDLVAVQRLQVKRVLDSIDKMSRRRRQRFRWVRRAGWLTVEWVLVGFMWYVWFVVMLVRVVLGAARGVVAGVRWLLWL